MLNVMPYINLLLLLILVVMHVYTLFKPKMAAIESKPIEDLRVLKDKFIDEGIALAEQMHHHNTKINKIGLTSYDKLKIASDWIKERLSTFSIASSDAEIRKLIEIHLGQKDK